VAQVAYVLDPTLVRGLDYYTRTVFEFTSDALGAQSGVGGGGRYDGLVELIKSPPTSPASPISPASGAPTAGIGWAAGVERILLAGDAPPVAGSPPELFIALGEESPEEHGAVGRERGVVGRRAAFEILIEARSAGLMAQMELAGRSLKGQLGYANALGARYVAIVGKDETVLKDMQGGGQERLATDTVVHAVLRGLHTL
jgi:histidyl-tRNA synthetase